jgi:hypothetical protein
MERTASREKSREKVIVWEYTMGELPELGGSAGFLNVKDFGSKTEMTVTIKEEPRIVDSNFKDKKGKYKKQCRVTLKLPKGDLRAWTMNNTTYGRLREAFGKSPKVWIGKKIKLNVQKMFVSGKTRDVIMGEPA